MSAYIDFSQNVYDTYTHMAYLMYATSIHIFFTASLSLTNTYKILSPFLPHTLFEALHV